jgi:heme-degrading monooxygenase HmoA
MILEAAILNVKSGQETEFEEAFRHASHLIASMPGYITHELHHCLEVKNKYLLFMQ